MKFTHNLINIYVKFKSWVIPFFVHFYINTYSFIYNTRYQEGMKALTILH